MPLFDYQCPKCGQRRNDIFFKNEGERRDSERLGELACPECKADMERVFGHATFNFKYKRDTAKSQSKHAID